MGKKQETYDEFMKSTGRDHIGAENEPLFQNPFRNGFKKGVKRVVHGLKEAVDISVQTGEKWEKDNQYNILGEQEQAQRVADAVEKKLEGR